MTSINWFESNRWCSRVNVWQGYLVSTGVNTSIGGGSSLGAAATLPGCVSIFGCAVPAGLGGVVVH
jgi:hypothetical protein